MDRGRYRGATALACYGFLALLLASHAAHAQVSVEIVSTAIGANGQFASVDADCPEGSFAVGGGTDVSDVSTIELTSSGPRFGETALLTMPDGPAGTPTGWRGGAANDSVTPGTVHVGVLCSQELAVSAVVASTSVTGGTFAGATATCPEGTVAIGGGASVGNLTMRITESGPQFPGMSPLAVMEEGQQPAPSGWTAFARNPGGGSPILKVAALCAELPDVFAVVGARTTMPNGGLAGGEVACPAGATALGGGIASLNPFELTVTSSAPRFAGDNADLSEQPDGTAPAPIAWNSRGRNDSQNTLRVVRAAICVPEPNAFPSLLAAIATLAGVARSRRQ